MPSSETPVFILPFDSISLRDLPRVGGKNASLGEMFSTLSPRGIPVPDGFAVTAEGYWLFLKENQLENPLAELMRQLDLNTFSNLPDIGARARALMMQGRLPQALAAEIREGYGVLKIREVCE